MVLHYFALKRVVSELDAALHGSRVDEVYSQSKNELRISLTTEGRQRALVISIQPGGNVLYWSDFASRAKRNTVDLFPEVVGQSIRSFLMHPADRTILIELDNGLSMALCLYNTASGNVYVTDDRLIIRDAFKHSKSHMNTALRLRTGGTDQRIGSLNDFIQGIRNSPHRSVLDALRFLEPLLGTLYCREVLHRSGLTHTISVSNLDDSHLAALHHSLECVIAEIEQSRVRVYVRGKEEPVVSTIPLSHLADWTGTEYESMNDAMKSGRGFAVATGNFIAERDKLLAQSRKEIDHLRKAIDALEHQMEESNRAEEYARKGNLIMTNLNKIRRGMKNIEVPDLYAGNQIVSIQLSPALGPNANAEYYFARARKVREGAEEAGRLLLERRGQLDRLTAKLEELEHVSSAEELQQLRRPADRRNKRPTPIESEEGSRVPFRTFTVAGGYDVWVGKNSQNNDELTTQYARPQDLWFHARSVGGSHVVLRVPGKSQVVPKESIVAAAAIAAYYSKMRKAKHVAVAYCEKKYVRKPKKAPAGTVLLERETVIFVNPKLP